MEIDSKNPSSTSVADKSKEKEIDSKNPSSTSVADKSKEKAIMRNKAVKGMSILIRLLPTGPIFFFRFLNPLFTDNGHCHTVNKVFAGILIILCGLSCCFSAFIDSFFGSDSLVHYGIATIKGILPSPASELLNLSVFKIKLKDFVIAFCTLIAFAVVALLDPNTIACYYPSLATNDKWLVMGLPPVVGFIVSVVFFFYGKKKLRRGIGYPASPTTAPDSC